MMYYVNAIKKGRMTIIKKCKIALQKFSMFIV